MNRETYIDSTAHVVEAVLGKTTFDREVHDEAMSSGRVQGRVRKAPEYERALQDVSITFSEDRTRSLERAKESGKLLSVLLQARNNTVLGENGFHNKLLLR